MWTKIFGRINGPYCLISDLTPSHFFIISNIFPEIIALFIGWLISPFSILKALLASTEKSPEIGFAVCAPKTLVVKTPSDISSVPIFSSKSRIIFDGLTDGEEDNSQGEREKITDGSN